MEEERLPRRLPRFLAIVAGVAGLLVAAVLALPFAIEWYLADFLRDRGVVNVSIGDVDLNPFTGEFSIESLEFEDDGVVRRAGHAALDLSWGDLANRRIRLTAVELRDASIEVRRTETNRWLLGTIVLGAQEAVEQAEESEEAAGWGIGIDHIELADVRIDYRDPVVAREFEVASASITDFATWLPDEPTTIDVTLTADAQRLAVAGQLTPFADVFDLALSVDGTALDLRGLGPLLVDQGVEEVQGALDIEGRIEVVAPADEALAVSVTASLAAADVEVRRSNDVANLESLRWDGSTDLTLAEAETTLRVEGTLTAGGLVTELPGTVVSLDSLRWRGQVATTLGEDVFRVEPTGALTAEALSLRQGDARPLATLQELQAALVTPGPDELLAVDRLELAGLTLLPREPSGPDQADHVVSLGGVNVDGVRVGEAIDVGAVRIEDPVVWIERRDDGQLELASRPEEPRESPDEDATVGADEDAADAPEPPAIAFDSVRITGQPRVVYRDRSVRPPVQLELTALEVELGRVALAEPEQDTPLSLSAALGRYGRLSFQGDIRPLAGRAHVLGDGRISDFDLVKLDGLARRGIGYSVESGTLSADLDVDIRDERLDSLADLTVRRLEIAALRPEEQDEFTADLGVPLGTALTVLEDNDDTIRLKVPLEGTADEFSVGVRDALRQVMQKGLITGLTTAATTYFAPVWPALAARKLFVAASALDFRAVDFAAGRSVLSPAERAYLGEVAQLLERRSKTSISLCGRAVAADRETLFPGAAGELDDVQAEALAALATRRLESVKDTLIANGIEGARLVSCRTEVSGTDGTSPRVDLGA